MSPFDKLSPNGQGVPFPFSLSLSKGDMGFDKLSPNGEAGSARTVSV